MPHTAVPVRHWESFGFLVVVLRGVVLPGAVQHLPQYGQAAQFFAVPEFRIGTQHTAGAHDAGRAQQLRLHLLAALLQLCRQLFQLQQFSSTLGSAFGSKAGGVGSFGSVQAGVLAGAAGSFAGLSGLGADGSHGLTGRGALSGSIPRFGGGKLELQPSLVQLLVGVQGGGAQQLGHGVADGVDAVGHIFQGVQRQQWR